MLVPIKLGMDNPIYINPEHVSSIDPLSYKSYISVRIHGRQYGLALGCSEEDLSIEDRRQMVADIVAQLAAGLKDPIDNETYQLLLKKNAEQEEMIATLKSQVSGARNANQTNQARNRAIVLELEDCIQLLKAELAARSYEGMT